MSAWKKISALFILSASVAVFAPACAADVQESEAPADPAATAEMAVEAELDDEADIATDSEALESNADDALVERGREFDFRCERRCREEFFRCRRFGRDDRDFGGRERRCRRRYDFCRDRCRRF